MKQIKRGKIPGFTVSEHLKVQEQIEQRAYELWLAGGSHQNGTFENWVRAEREVLEDFIHARTHALDFRGNC
jgi:Protein of unknown function (DUF2934)